MADTFKKYLAEAAKQYDFVIKVAGDLEEGFEDQLEVALKKFDVANLSAGKKTPIQSVPLDFPQLTNTEVTVYETTVNYPTTQHELRAYLSGVLNMQDDMIRVRKPGEPTEEYQDNMQVAKKSEYANKLMDIEYKDAPKVNAEDFHSTKANMGLLKELLKDRETNKDQPKEKENAQSKEEKGSPSPIKAAHKGPVKGNPDPMGK